MSISGFTGHCSHTCPPTPCLTGRPEAPIAGAIGTCWGGGGGGGGGETFSSVSIWYYMVLLAP